MKRLIAEFEAQSFTQIIFPHAKTDWAEYLEEAQTTFTNIINVVALYQPVLVVCADVEYVKSFFKNHKNLFFVEYTTDDTWARDCSALSIVEDATLKLLDFDFTAWGGKFESSQDNKMTQALATHYSTELLNVEYTLEGGAIESNGAGTLLTTTNCMNNTNRNSALNVVQRERRLKEFFGLKEILSLNHGYLIGDDTDSHIDTLARFVASNVVMYVVCKNRDDEHYVTLSLMRKELQKIAQTHNYKLIPLPLPSALYYENERLPATYANFLFVNGAVLVPTYGVKEDEEALEIFRETFKDREVIGVDCSVLVRQHGSLHCVTMNFAKGVELIFPK
jgi:agmatine/peptidylarginine deiminase